MDGESGELRRCGRSMNRQVRDRLLWVWCSLCPFPSLCRCTEFDSTIIFTLHMCKPSQCTFLKLRSTNSDLNSALCFLSFRVNANIHMFVSNLLPGYFVMFNFYRPRLASVCERNHQTWMNEWMNERMDILMEKNHMMTTYTWPNTIINTYAHVVHKIIHGLHVVHLKWTRRPASADRTARAANFRWDLEAT